MTQEDGMVKNYANLAINQVFKTRNTHEIPKALPAPPESWQSIFKEQKSPTLAKP